MNEDHDMRVMKEESLREQEKEREHHMSKDPIREINKIAAEMGLGKLPRGTQKSSIRYWQVKGDFFSFGYTPWKDPDGKYYALRYRSGMLMKKVAFGRRKKAKERAYRWFLKRIEVLKFVAAKKAAKEAAKPQKPNPTKLQVAEAKLQRIQNNIKKMETKKKRLETLLKKRRKSAKYVSKRIEKLKGADLK